MGFSHFLKSTNATLYRDYLFEKFANQRPVVRTKTVAEIFKEKIRPIDNYCLNVADLLSDHDAVRYLTNRHIPSSLFGRFYYTENLNDLNSLFPRYQETKFVEEPRLILPIYNRQKELIGVTCRALFPSKQRYIELKRNDDDTLIFNLENIDFNHQIYITEGGFDCLFLNNAAAANGSDFFKIMKIMPPERSVLVFDNQPKNRQLIYKMEKIVSKGWPMCIWPDTIKEKDINNMIVSGMTSDEVQQIIENNVYSGLRLQLEFQKWIKIDLRKRVNEK